MKNLKKVTVFVGERDTILSLYDDIKCYVDAEVVCSDRKCELRVQIADYAKAVGLGSQVVQKKNVNRIAWVSPCGDYVSRFNETATQTTKLVARGMMTAFSGSSAIEISKVANRLESVGINALATTDERDNWVVVVRPENYLEAVSIGSKFVDGSSIKEVRWNDPTGAVKFNIDSVARVARTDLDEVLEA